MKFAKVCVIVLDSVGIGELPDASRFGDAGANTLGHIAEQVPGFSLPNLQILGLGNIAPLRGVAAVERPLSYYGKMAETSVGKDTMTGHWELMGLRVDTEYKTYPAGFPEELIAQFESRTGRKVIGNTPASGTEILEQLGEEQRKTGAWIVYTSSDSVFQIAAHEEVIPLEELYRACRIARELTLQDEFGVGRVIARPYVGAPGRYERTANRHDYAVKPPAPTILNRLATSGFDVVAIGKINDIFSGEGITRSFATASNQVGMLKTQQLLRTNLNGLVFTNLVDFDSKFGHRRDPAGYADALMQFDSWIPNLLRELSYDDLLIITADHGNDPTYPGTDHTREYVPILAYSPKFRNSRSLGIRNSFSDLAATLAEIFGVEGTGQGTSFLSILG
ncbi:phosphopentomutase [Paenibacillus cymbidii]|uniref:phosphopentomutase n=1 Tax=Paenibacillus cymbidii TaxID=1639034 RepID=UPI001081B616|nr:phosphopentomutase [Paenibacillus cymbidii]